MKPQTFSDLPLRQRKHAQTQLALLDALLERLGDRTLEEISVKELSAAANISPGTFFNYFPSKVELLTFFIQVWALDVTIAAREVQADGGLAAIERVFASTAEASEAQPAVMLEVIAHQARMPANPQVPGVSIAFRLLRYPQVADVLELPAGGLQDVLPRLLEQAICDGELPPTCDVSDLMLALVSVFFGVPLLLTRTAPEAIAPQYQRQLRRLWAGARAGGF